MRPLLAVCLAATVAIATPALAAPVRVRGTIATVHGNTMEVRTTAGPMRRIALGAKTVFHRVTRSSLSRVAPGSYIGTAAKSVDGKLVALEVLVFPPAMRGVGEGHYKWDRLPDPTRPGHATAASSMTNGTVTTAAPATVATTMTNGTVAAAAGAAGGERITVTYKGGKQQVLVPPSVPIVTLLPGSRAELKPGAPVFVVAKPMGGALTALAVNVGIDGVRPPM
ncbi:MAG: hypothetical protein ACP5NP_15765 [Acetobacteraceae bacterium]